MPIWRRSMRDLFEGGAAVYPVEAQGSSTAGSDAFTQTRMRTLAQLTGGKAFYGGNDPFPEILQTSNGNVAGYVLELAREANATPEFHRLQVTVNKPGSLVNSAAGYFPAEGTLKSRAQEDVTLALQSPLAYSGLVFSLKSFRCLAMLACSMKRVAPSISALLRWPKTPRTQPWAS
jgi:hypothetical protein